MKLSFIGYLWICFVTTQFLFYCKTWRVHGSPKVLETPLQNTISQAIPGSWVSCTAYGALSQCWIYAESDQLMYKMWKHSTAYRCNLQTRIICMEMCTFIFTFWYITLHLYEAKWFIEFSFCHLKIQTDRSSYCVILMSTVDFMNWLYSLPPLQTVFVCRWRAGAGCGFFLDNARQWW